MKYGETLTPAWNTFSPSSEMFIDSAGLLLSAAKMSASRPPQPVRVTTSARGVCHSTDWSECENSCGGNGVPGTSYIALLTGCTSGPTFATIAARPALNMACVPVIDGCRPNKPCGLARLSSASNCACGMARLPRVPLYVVKPASRGITILKLSLPPYR